jgi:hypothetical protein
VNSNDFGIDKKLGLTAFGKSLGELMAGQPTIPLSEGRSQHRRRKKRKAGEDLITF